MKIKITTPVSAITVSGYSFDFLADVDEQIEFRWV